MKKAFNALRSLLKNKTFSLLSLVLSESKSLAAAVYMVKQLF